MAPEDGHDRRAQFNLWYLRARNCKDCKTVEPKEVGSPETRGAQGRRIGDRRDHITDRASIDCHVHDPDTHHLVLHPLAVKPMSRDLLSSTVIGNDVNINNDTNTETYTEFRWLRT
jgi:hypothetical protein